LVLATKENLEETTQQQLKSAGVEVRVLEESWKDGLEGLKRRITAVADIYQQQEKGAELIAQIEARASKLQHKVSQSKTKPKVFFLYAHGPGDAFITGTDSGADVLINMAGGINAA